MATRRAGGVNVLVTREAITAAGAAGRRTLPRETGGILLGFRTPDLIVVTRALVVDDPASSGRTYLRHRRRAQALLTAARQESGVIGYVGEWHTHPEDKPSSPTDLRALGKTARMTPSVVALLVLGYSQQEPHRLHTHVASRSGVMPIAAIDLVDVEDCVLTITDDTTESLEQEASALLRLTHRENHA